MGDFDFSTCVVEQGVVYCIDKNGKIYRMALPEEVPVEKCPVCVIPALLKAALNRRG
jgi:hypothetical protein